MKPSDDFKTAIENYLNTTAQGDSSFARSLAKETKNIESCFNYIFGEVKKTGLCAFDNHEIFDMFKYYNYDSIGAPAKINCKVVVNQPVMADLFNSVPAMTPQVARPDTAVVQTAKPAQKTLTLFDL
ncbi:Cas9 inhibitor AcrIIA9 family protein [Flavobacterium sp. CSZ]|uniref:PcfK-like family protein n=1 Tax=Flavobacterium sp. CSZ TaxID=2783791 RepID=UPI00188CCFE4|nr:Cas9 inhibitor AcrIIA9 family protein [Flavobacterium sp. CSZ]MBF4486220.1 PcfK-like family protein [Flavobacterium sp. CSZ]